VTVGFDLDALCIFTRLALVNEKLNNTETNRYQPDASNDFAKFSSGSLSFVIERICHTLISIHC